MATALNTADPGRAEFQSDLAAAHYAAGFAESQVGDWPAALASFRSAAEGHRRLLAQAPGDQSALRDWALCEKRMGAIMIRSQRYAEAAEHYRRALAADESRMALAPENAPARRDVSVTCVDLSIALRYLGDRPGEAAHLRRALQIREQLARADPSNVLAQVDLVSARWRIGSFLTRQGDWRAALRELDPAVAAAEKLTGTRQDQLVEALFVRADAHQRAGNSRAMLADRRRAFELSRTLMLQATSVSKEIAFVESAEAVGDALSASARRAAPANAPELWREARAAYAQGLERALDLEARKALIGAKVAMPGRLRAASIGATAPWEPRDRPAEAAPSAQRHAPRVAHAGDRQHLRQHVRGHLAVHLDQHQRAPAARLAPDVHARDVDLAVAEQRAHVADDARACPRSSPAACGPAG